MVMLIFICVYQEHLVGLSKLITKSIFIPKKAVVNDLITLLNY